MLVYTLPWAICLNFKKWLLCANARRPKKMQTGFWEFYPHFVEFHARELLVRDVPCSNGCKRLLST